MVESLEVVLYLRGENVFRDCVCCVVAHLKNGLGPLEWATNDWVVHDVEELLICD